MSARSGLVERSIPMPRKIAWGVGSLGTGLVLNVQTIFYSNYLVDYVGLSAATVGVLLLVAKACDLVTDLPIGWLSDRTRTKLGRRRPYLLIGSILCGLTFAVIFNVPFADATSMKIYVGVSLIGFFLAYTIYAVPYIAIPAEMTDDYHERSSIMSWRVSFAMLSTTFGATVTGFLIDYFGGGAQGFSGMSFVLGGIIVLFCFTAFVGVPTETVTHEPGTRQSNSVLTNIRLIASNKPFLTLLTAKALQLLAFACNIGIQVFFFVQVLGVSFSTYGLLAMWKGIATIVCVGIWTRVSKVFGKRNTYIVCAAGWGLVTLTWIMAGPEEPVWITAVRFVFIGVFASGQILMGLSIFTDTIEFDRRRTGLRREGIFSGIYTSAEKLAFMLAPAISGIYLTMSGYQPGLGAAGGQPASAITAIYILLAIVPAILNAVSVAILFTFRLEDSDIKSAPAIA